MGQVRFNIWQLIVYANGLVLAVILFGVADRALAGRQWEQQLLIEASQLALATMLAIIFSAAFLVVRPQRPWVQFVRNILLFSGEFLSLFLAARLFRISAGLYFPEIAWYQATIFIFGSGIAITIALALIERIQSR